MVRREPKVSNFMKQWNIVKNVAAEIKSGEREAHICSVEGCVSKAVDSSFSDSHSHSDNDQVLSKLKQKQVEEEKQGAEEEEEEEDDCSSNSPQYSFSNNTSFSDFYNVDKNIVGDGTGSSHDKEEDPFDEELRDPNYHSCEDEGCLNMKQMKVARRNLLQFNFTKEHKLGRPRELSESAHEVLQEKRQKALLKRLRKQVQRSKERSNSKSLNRQFSISSSKQRTLQSSVKFQNHKYKLAPIPSKIEYKLPGKS
eukprot:CAMPEP_0168616270 /NCGR_PEP_ID=MMETSP0449_2-20121227/4942_1 /TAXON_ID=1082188 /ORGANISM="Strombidium rassoulzadegani, Strain ras09" /LENGTH=253 /DNA_ID=CAMNT_0008657053 /DNA_START=142 /DNA_END=899 /DNA_ORIENTATION=-